MDAERLAVAADKTDLLVRGDTGQRRAALGVQHQSGVARQLGRIEQRRVIGDRHPLAAVEGIDRCGSHGQFRHARPAGIDRPRGVVLVGVDADGGRLHPQRHVFGDERDVPSLCSEVERYREDAGVVAFDTESGGQCRDVCVIQLDRKGAAGVTDRHRRVEAAVLHAQIVQRAQRLPGEPAQFWVVSLALQLADHDQRYHHVVLAEAAQRPGVGEQDGRVDHEGAYRGRTLRLEGRGHRTLLGA
jgi:hypothetical protein